MTTAIVTGAASGIAFAVAESLADRGVDVLRWDVRAPDRSDDRGWRRVDVSGPAQISEAFASLDRDSITADILVSCAGVFEATPFVELDAAVWDRTMAVNLRGAVLCAVEASKRMIDRGGGRVVFVSSIAAASSEPESCAYSASKAALTAVVRSMAVDVSRLGVSVNSVAPGWVATGMTEGYLAETPAPSFDRVNPLGRVGEAAEIANVVTYLSLDAPAYLTGANLVVDGGQLALAALPGS